MEELLSEEEFSPFKQSPPVSTVESISGMVLPVNDAKNLEVWKAELRRAAQWVKMINGLEAGRVVKRLDMVERVISLVDKIYYPRDENGQGTSKQETGQFIVRPGGGIVRWQEKHAGQGYNSKRVEEEAERANTLKVREALYKLKEKEGLKELGL